MKVYGDEITFRDRWKEMKNRSGQERFDYFVQYYGKITLAIVFGIVVLVLVTVAVIKNKAPKVISGDFYTEYFTPDAAEPLRLLLCERLGYDPDKYGIDVYSSAVDGDDREGVMYQGESLQAKIVAGVLDFVAALPKDISGYMDKDDIINCSFHDLRDILPEDLLGELESQGRIVYLETSFRGSLPYLVDITDSKLYSTLGLTKDECYIAVLASTKRVDACVELCRLAAEPAD